MYRTLLYCHKSFNRENTSILVLVMSMNLLDSAWKVYTVQTDKKYGFIPPLKKKNLPTPEGGSAVTRILSSHNLSGNFFWKMLSLPELLGNRVDLRKCRKASRLVGAYLRDSLEDML